MMISKDLEGYERRCPRLGGQIPFRYCLRAEGRESVCRHIIDCWWESFDVTTFLKTHLSEQAFKDLTGNGSVNKVSSLVEHIQKARERLSGK
ncbi:hypothetical protein [Desulfococcus multivorans]|jgi:hypothetical protein|uniref:Uncharacterized protein n=1 Tax=Desulfococcus multivorans DSM 2059 TaxID=1121405 RepID=S7TZU1_DESML|nr:hypothetical protein [Desulfococcus multivorans]AOY58317.1 conserved uncharacterized protein [Desulfococcus multivorans]AQV00652.1 hypothetical protein B2D07_07610 [Desulfococcus multivorans]EPR42607.1 hypothetical protein dsmv_1595 [Desulfococcus multivorans DSM 2059]SKA17959.1 hypothetical protein SAMN02745446_03109 [Desulfococcus multivorans DSM 2059]